MNTLLILLILQFYHIFSFLNKIFYFFQLQKKMFFNTCISFNMAIYNLNYHFQE